MYKTLLKYAGIFFLAYILLSLFLGRPGVKKSHATYFKNTTESVVTGLMPKMFMRFDPGDPENAYVVRVVFNSQENVDNQVAEAKRNRIRNINLEVFDFNFDIFVLYILPLGFLMSLIIASPVQWKRKLLALGLGYLALLIFCIIRLWILCLHQVSRETLQIYDYNDGVISFLGTVSSFFTPGFVIIVSVFIWIAVTFRKSDYKRLKSLIA